MSQSCALRPFKRLFRVILPGRGFHQQLRGRACGCSWRRGSCTCPVGSCTCLSSCGRWWLRGGV